MSGTSRTSQAASKPIKEKLAWATWMHTLIQKRLLGNAFLKSQSIYRHRILYKLTMTMFLLANDAGVTVRHASLQAHDNKLQQRPWSRASLSWGPLTQESMHSLFTWAICHSTWPCTMMTRTVFKPYNTMLWNCKFLNATKSHLS